ncbi:hypothetical protein DH2020_047457 [Rehmannia glutinosa]|uniref:NAC domain-containing protein n=1 Tax=Rehmannia glutinosa TaxID=99300 RepID=A0ABR0U926_REHGL
MGLPIPWSILEKDLYGERANPWDVFSDVNDSAWEIVKDVNRVIYVFTKLSKVNAEKTRIARRAGCGSWNGQTTRKIFNASKKLIGFMKMFSFKVTKEGGSEDTRVQQERDDHWIMHEYSLAGVSLQYELKYKDYVICKITRTCKANKQFDQQQPIISSSVNNSHETNSANSKRSSDAQQEEEDSSSRHSEKKQKTTTEEEHFAYCQSLVDFNGLTQDDYDVLHTLGL